MSILSRLLGLGGRDVAADPGEDYKGFTIVPHPVRQGDQFRVGARIEKGDGDAMRVHDLVRADTFPDLQSARDASVAKARQVIDEQGDAIFR